MSRFSVGGEGTLSIPPNTLDPVGQNGDIHYRPDNYKLRIHLAGAWRNIAMEDSTDTGRYIYVDQDNTSAIDNRTGLSKYAIGVPFKTISAAIMAAVDNDIVYVQHSSVPYEGDIVLDPLGFNGWTKIQLVLDNAVINGNVELVQSDSVYTAIWGMGPQRGTINGRISGPINFQLNYFANLTVLNGIYGTSNVDTLYENCIITWTDPIPYFPRGIILNSRLVFDAPPLDGAFRGTVIFDNCDLVFTAGIFSLVTNSGDLHFENCRIRIGGSILIDSTTNDFRTLARNCRIGFGFYLIPGFGYNKAPLMALHSCQLISNEPGTASVILMGSGTAAYTELISCVHNCPVGAIPTVEVNDYQAPSLTDF